MSDWETSKDQDDVREPPRSTYKRRSSVFQLVAQKNEESEVNNIDDDEEDDREENRKPVELDASSANESFDLSGYTEKLRNERKEWKKTLNARKSRRRNLEKRKAITGSHGADFDISILSESERAFILDRPNYEQISRNIKTLADAAVKVATLNQEIEVLKDRLTLKIEQKLRNATKKVIGMSSET